MTEKKYETVSEFVKLNARLVPKNYRVVKFYGDIVEYKTDEIFKKLDKQFINKDKLIDEIKKGLKKCEDSLNNPTLKKTIFDYRKGICNGFENILKLLEE